MSWIMRCSGIFFLLFIHFSYAASHRPQDFLNAIKQNKDEGQQIVTHFCASCHASNPLISVGAPRMHHPEDWKTRLLKGQEGLLKQTDLGLGLMPPRGGCFECSEQQLREAIAYMLRSKK